MQKRELNGRIVLEADEGMVLTNGTAHGKTVYLAEGLSGEEFYEVPESELVAEAEGEADV